MTEAYRDSTERWQRVADWRLSAAGELLLAAEEPALARELEALFGSYLLHFGVWPQALPELSSVRHCVGLSPLPGADIVCEETAWPIVPQSADAVLLRHGLEFAHNPRQLLREAALSVRPGGHLLIVGLNPWSGWGVGSLFAKDALGQARMLSAQRVQDWLELLGFSVEKRKVGCYRPPLTSVRWQARLSWLDPLGVRWHAPGAGFYLLVARKLSLGVRTPKPARRKPIGQLLPTPAVKVSARTLDKPCKRSE